MKRILIVLLIAIFVSSCAPDKIPVPTGAGTALQNENGIQYEIIEIEGMPCIWILGGESLNTSSATRYAGLDCDWSKHPSNLSQ